MRDAAGARTFHLVSFINSKTLSVLAHSLLESVPLILGSHGTTKAQSLAHNWQLVSTPTDPHYFLFPTAFTSFLSTHHSSSLVSIVTPIWLKQSHSVSRNIVAHE